VIVIAAVSLATGLAMAVASSEARFKSSTSVDPVQAHTRAEAAGRGAVRMRARRIMRLRGTLRYGRLFSTQRPLPLALRRRLERTFHLVNPGAGQNRQTTRPVPGPRGPQSTEGSFDFPRQAPDPHPGPPRPGGAAALAPRAPVARAAAANDFELFRSQRVAAGAGVTSLTGEPSVANDRNMLLFTGNNHAAVSSDNGITWQYINPADTDLWPNSDGGFCCDQVAYSVSRGGYSLIFWLLQYRNDGDTTPSDDTTGRLRLAVFQGRNELGQASSLANEVIEQADFCTVDFKPSQFGFVDSSYFDFNQIGHTEEFLYISSKARQNLGDTNGDGTLETRDLDGVVWRMSLDDLDGQDCNFATTAWHGAGTGRNPALVQSSGGLDEMHWASQGSSTDEIVITRVRDNTTTGTIHTRSITPFLQTERTATTASAPSSISGTCPLPDTGDPCWRENDDINTGYGTPTEVGWFWNVRQGSGFPFPHIRGARFATTGANTPRLIDEPDVWNDDHAFFYPAVGVNSANHVAFLAWRAGGPSGARKPISTRAALVDDVTPGWASLSFNGLITSTHGVGSNTWGDYQQVRPYTNCSRTFAVATHSMQGGTGAANAEARFAWIGRERDGCADLSVVALSAYTLNVEGPETLVIGSTTRNIGSGTAGASTTRYYLSRDAVKSNGDTLLGDPADVPSLGADTSYGDLALPTVPVLADGAYYVIGCADDLVRVAEVTDANQCLAAPQTVTVAGGAVARQRANLSDIVAGTRNAGWRRGSNVFVEFDLDIPPRPGQRQGVVSFHLGTRPTMQNLREVGRTNVNFASLAAAAGSGGGERRRVHVRRRIRLPRRGFARRRQFLVACIGARPRADRCVPARFPIYLRGVSRR
jgi:hypothetical protein